MYLSGKMDILAALGVQECYFEVSSSALCYTQAFRSEDHTHFFCKTQENHFTVKLTTLNVY